MGYKLEYIWLDGYKPEPSLRSKTKIVNSEPSDVSDCPEWSFDGSSTEQAEGSSSDCLLKPVRMVPDPDAPGHTGLTGQDGSYLAEFLLEKGYEVTGMVRRTSTINFERIGRIGPLADRL